MNSGQREFEVEVTIESTHLFNVMARTPEEAESIAETLVDDGDRGETVETCVLIASAVVIGDEPLEEEEEIESVTD